MANLVATIVGYYKKCYDEFSVCLTTNTYNLTFRSKYKLIQSSADDWCKQNSSSLAIITNETVQSAIAAFINDSSAKLDSDVITNGYRYNLSYWYWNNNLRADISGLNYYSGYGFLVVLKNEILYSIDRQATAKRKFICSYPSYDSNCPDGDQQLGMRCYKIHNKYDTWFDARRICLKEEGGDLASLDDGDLSLTSQRRDEYWIGLRRERWVWINKGTSEDMKYSNWDDGNPSSAGGKCLCLKARANKWKTCDCSQEYRYICIQDYASGSVSTVTTTTTTHSTLATIPTVHSTSTETEDVNFKERTTSYMKTPENLGMLLGLGIGSGCLLILIIVIAVVVFIKNRRRGSGDVGPRHGNSSPPAMHKDSPPPTKHNDDAPSTVYAVVMPNDNEPVRSPSEKTSNQTVYADLDLEPKRKVAKRASEPVRHPSKKTPNEVFYEDLDLAPKGNTLGRALPESEYANSSLVDSVYANSAQTKV